MAESESGVVLGKGGFISRRRRARAWLMTASTSSRRLESESSDSACGMVGRLAETRRGNVDASVDKTYFLEQVESFWSFRVCALIRMNDWKRN